LESWFRDEGPESRVPGLGGIQGLGSRFKVQGSGFRVQGSRFRVQGSGFVVEDSGLRVQGLWVGV